MPSRRRSVLPWLLACGLLLPVSQARGEAGLLSGMVRGDEEAHPIASAHVYAYSLADFELRKALTDVAGKFRFAALPAGLYHIVAYKSGFVPAVVALTRPGAERSQVVDLHLMRQEIGDPRAAEDYFEVRSRIPPDVLREIDTLEVLAASIPGNRLALPSSRFETGVLASAGVDDIVAVGDGQLAGGRVDFRGQFESLDIDVQGNFWRLQPLSTASGAAAAWGSTNQVSVDLKSEGDARFNLDAGSNRLVTRQDGVELPVDFDHLRLSYSQPMGSLGESAFAAQMIDESNFYRQGPVEPAAIPQASKTWEVEGSYSREIGDRSLIETGVRYRERQVQEWAFPGLLGAPVERVDLFGRGGYRVRPAMLIEYGVYSVLRDGELALAPQGGLVVQINPEWQFGARASGRAVGETVSPLGTADFLPVLHRGSGRGCDRGEESCYQLELSRHDEENAFSVGAVHREFGETLRLYFSSDFFDQQESIYLVPGDRLPELQVALTRRLSPNVLTRLQGNLASGGGGTYYAADRDAYHNEVRYLITSLDTRFQSTSTGVFLAFHQLEQELTPLREDRPPAEALLTERLQLKVSQDLNVLLDLPADWALHLNMELSRGNREEGDPDDVRRRILGGIAVKF